MVVPYLMLKKRRMYYYFLVVVFLSSPKVPRVIAFQVRSSSFYLLSLIALFRMARAASHLHTGIRQRRQLEKLAFLALPSTISHLTPSFFNSYEPVHSSWHLAFSWQLHLEATRSSLGLAHSMRRTGVELELSAYLATPRPESRVLAAM